MQPNLSHLHEPLPLWLGLLFAFITLAGLAGLYTTLPVNEPKLARRILLGLSGWLALTAMLAASGFFLQTSSTPPRFIFAIMPPVLFIAGMLGSRSGRRFADSLPLHTLTLIHTIRIPVELVIYTFFVYQQVPEAMTFEGRNLDIIPGITAPIIAWLVFNRNIISQRWLLLWNLISLGFLLNIVITAVLSAPVPFQQFGFEQPNVAVFKFPFIWLPAFIVPLVLFCHLVAIRQLVPTLLKREVNHSTSSDKPIPMNSLKV